MGELMRHARRQFTSWRLRGRIKERYRLIFKPKFDTAVWEYKNKEHRIYIGGRIEKLFDDPKIGVKAATAHEFGHSLFTERNMESFSKRLQEEGIPFPLYNLFEDCRMEEAVRRELKEPFLWKRCTKGEFFGVGHPEPTSYLLSIKFFEGDKKEAREEFLKAGGDREIAKRVEEFYDLAIRAASSYALIPIMKRWIEQFSSDTRATSSYVKGTMSEAGMSEEEAEAFSAFTACSDLETDPGGEEGENELFDPYSEGHGDMLKDAEPVNRLDEFSDAEILAHGKPDPFSIQKVKRIESILKRMLEGEVYIQSSRRFSKRLHAANAVMEREDEFKRKVIERSGTKTVSLIVDCSGSMYRAMDEMKVLVAVFNRFAKEGLLEGYLILSASIGCETIRLPLPEKKIEYLDGRYGSEGIARTMQRTLPILKRSDWVFVLTDGNLTDDPVDRTQYNKEGIHTYGIYVGAEAKNLSRWFDFTINHPTIEAVAYELVKKIKRRRRR